MSIFSPHSKRSSTRPFGLAQGKGFTLLEMLIVMTIMIIISLVFLVRQSRFDSSTVLRSLAYSVALSVRQAQVYGTSVLGTTTASAACTGGFYNATNGSCYAAAYGLYFTPNATSYVLFADLNNNGQYDTNEVVKTFQLGTGYSLNNFCILDNSGNAYCSAAACPASIPFNLSYTACTGNSLVNTTVLFRRPNPDACFDDNGGGFCSPGVAPVNRALYLQLIANGDMANPKGITVSTTGEVSVCSGGSC
jgi:prepilin-type N-terminal cleavage/methylation domain-containing protein